MDDELESQRDNVQRAIDEMDNERSPNYELYPLSGYPEHEEWVKNGGSIVDGQRWGWL